MSPLHCGFSLGFTRRTAPRNLVMVVLPKWSHRILCCVREKARVLLCSLCFLFLFLQRDLCHEISRCLCNVIVLYVLCFILVNYLVRRRKSTSCSTSGFRKMSENVIYNVYTHARTHAHTHAHTHRKFEQKQTTRYLLYAELFLLTRLLNAELSYTYTPNSHPDKPIERDREREREKEREKV